MVRNAFVVMRLFTVILAVAVLGWLPVQAEPWNPRNLARIQTEAPDPLRFAVLGDSHNVDAVFTKIIAALNRTPGLSFAVHLGDMVPWGTPEHFEHFFRRVQPLQLPLVAAIGNHELQGWSSWLPGADARYQKLFGALYYSFRVGQHHFLVLNNSRSRPMDQDQVNWLEEELTQAAGAKTRLVFMHKPLFDPRPGQNHAMDPPSARAVLEILKRHRVTRVFTGHIHNYRTGDWEGVPYTISGGAGGELVGQDPNAAFHHYLTVTLSGAEVGIEVHRIPAPPRPLEPASGPGG